MAKGSSVFAAELLIAEVAGEYRRTVGPVEAERRVRVMQTQAEPAVA